MDSQRAKEILALYRPGSTDAVEPPMAEAIEQAQRDPELVAWLEQQKSVNAAIRAKLKAIPIPRGLQRQIILSRKESPRAAPLPGAVKIAAAAVALVIVSASAWFAFSPTPSQVSFQNYRERMVGKVQRGVPYMQMFATNQEEILDYCRKQGGPADFVLSTNLEHLAAIGGAVLNWNGQKVTLLRFNAGEEGTTNDLWIFVIGKGALPDPPPTKTKFATVGGLMTASWSAGSHVYILTGVGTDTDLQKYLGSD